MIEQLIKVDSFWRYPVTGGPGVPCEEIEVFKGGLAGDRTLILAEETPDGLTRLGSKQAPGLLSIRSIKM